LKPNSCCISVILIRKTRNETGIARASVLEKPQYALCKSTSDVLGTFAEDGLAGGLSSFTPPANRK
jgi:hypothetical protein